MIGNDANCISKGDWNDPLMTNHGDIMLISSQEGHSNVEFISIKLGVGVSMDYLAFSACKLG